MESIRMEYRDAFGSKLTIVGEEEPPSKEVKVSALAEEKLPDDFVIPDDLQSLIVSDIIVSKKYASSCIDRMVVILSLTQ